MHTPKKKKKRKEKNASPLCTQCMLMPQLIPHSTLTLVCTWCEESTPQGLGSCGYLEFHKCDCCRLLGN